MTRAKNYELTYLISPDLSEEESKITQDKIASLVKNEGGVLNGATTPINKYLGIPIKKKRSAYLSSLSFQLGPEKLENVREGLKQESRILRYLILTQPKVRETAVRTRKPRLKEAQAEVKKPEAKVELKEIEKKLEEILGE